MTTVVGQSVERRSPLERITADFERFVRYGDGRTAGWVDEFRRRGFEELQRVGIPTVRHEEWKYTNLYTLLAKQFSAVWEADVDDVGAVVAPLQRWGEVVTVVNGQYVGAAAGHVRSLAQLLASDGVQLPLGELARIDDSAIIAWNAAFLRDGVVIDIPPATYREQPLVIASVLAARSSNIVCHERHLLTVGAGARVQLIFVQRAVGEAEALLNQVLEGWIGEGAEVDIVVVQDGSAATNVITTHELQLERNACLRMVTVSIGGGFVRNMPAARLSGEGADVQLYGLTLARDAMLIDHHTVVDHRVPHCTSNQLYKAILDDRAVGVFNGKIYVRPNAQKTSAYQANRNIVLSRRATINTKPQLEIFANDVRCTHGCTVGRLDSEALFYLRSRGLSKEEAEALLLTAFAEEITAQIISEVLRADVNATIEHILHADELA